MLIAALTFAAGAAEPLAFPSAPDPTLWPPGLEAVELGFTGDTMVHGMQVKAARQPDGTYTMDGLFDAIAPWLASPDLMAANLETTIAGEDLEYTGYPRFNSPPALLDELRGSGVDLLQTTNNHCLDRGAKGLLRTLDAVDEYGFLHTGTYRSAEEREAQPFAMATLGGGLRVAYLAYTYGTEAGFFDHDAWWRVAYISQDRFGSDIAKARAAGADLVVVGVHWGREYKHAPDRAEVELAHRIVQLGADVVWGTHPHVLQPAEIVTVEAPEGPRDALILYSLGNFVSNQRTPDRDGGMIVRLTVLRDAARDRSWLADVRFTPIWVDDRLDGGKLHFRVLPTVSTPALCGDPDVSAADCDRLLGFRAHAAEIFPADRISDEVGPPAWAALLPIGASTGRFRYF